MLERNVLCVGLSARPDSIEEHLRSENWDVLSVGNLATARLALMRMRFCCCIVLLDHMDAAHSAEIESLLKASRTLEWVAIFPTHALEEPNFRDLVVDSFLDYHTHPVDLGCLTHIVAHAHRRVSLRAMGHADIHGSGVDAMGMVGQSPAIVRLRRQIKKVAATSAPILIGGESGSGKELAAQAIHRHSQRSAGPFVAVNCGAIAPALVQSELFGHERGAFTGASADKRGLIEMANGGTLFLDEIADLPLEMQTNLLRFLQEKTIHRVGGARALRVDARVVAASHVDLAEAVASGRFREDLYYRLNVLEISVPPLRDRKDDVPLLAQHFYQRCAAEKKTRVEGFNRRALAALMAHDWPGNVRELFNRVQRAVVMTDRRLITPADLGIALETWGTGPGLVAVRTLAERDAIRLTLNRVGRNVTHAARELGVSRMTLYRLMDKHSIASGMG